MAGVPRKTRAGCVHTFLPNVDDMGTTPRVGRVFSVLTAAAGANKMLWSCRPQRRHISFQPRRVMLRSARAQP